MKRKENPMSTMCIAIGQCGTNIAGRLLQQHSQLRTDHNVSVMLVDSSVNTLSAHQIVFGEDMQGAHAIHLRSSIVKGLGTMAKREDALAVYAENEVALLALLDGIAKNDQLILVAGMGGGIGSVITTRLAQEAARRNLRVSVYGTWTAPWEHDRRKDNCRWVEEQLQAYPVTCEFVDPEPLIVEYCKTRNQSDRSVLDFMKTIWNDAIAELIIRHIRNN